jgi:hypothetical protein
MMTATCRGSRAKSIFRTSASSGDPGATGLAQELGPYESLGRHQVIIRAEHIVQAGVVLADISIDVDRIGVKIENRAEIDDANFCRVISGVDASDVDGLETFDAQSVAAHSLKMFATRNKMHIRTAVAQTSAKVAAQST